MHGRCCCVINDTMYATTCCTRRGLWLNSDPRTPQDLRDHGLPQVIGIIRWRLSQVSCEEDKSADTAQKYLLQVLKMVYHEKDCKFYPCWLFRSCSPSMCALTLVSSLQSSPLPLITSPPPRSPSDVIWCSPPGARGVVRAASFVKLPASSSPYIHHALV